VLHPQSPLILSRSAVCQSVSATGQGLPLVSPVIQTTDLSRVTGDEWLWSWADAHDYRHVAASRCWHGCHVNRCHM